MGLVEQEFAFSNVSGQEGQTYVDKDVITMEITGDANGIHEFTHGWQINAGEIIGGAKGNNVYPNDKNSLYNT